MTTVAICCPGPSLDDARVEGDVIAAVNSAVLQLPRVDWWHAHDFGRLDGEAARTDRDRMAMEALWHGGRPLVGIVRCTGLCRLPERLAGIEDVNADRWAVQPNNLNWHFTGPTALWFHSARHPRSLIRVYGCDLNGQAYSGAWRSGYAPSQDRWASEAPCWELAAARAMANGCEIEWHGKWSPSLTTTTFVRR